MMENVYDVVIVGGGPAGLSAALILARCLRKVIVLDSGKPRNRFVEHSHGFLSRDGIAPLELLNISREQLKKYDVELKNSEVVDAKINGGFEITDSEGIKYKSKKLLLSTGITDCLPPIEGFDELYGKSIFHCPFCDGYESKDKRIAVYGNMKNGKGSAFMLSHWSKDVILFTDGKITSNEDKNYLDKAGIKINTEKILRFDGENGKLKGIRLKNGSFVERDKIFFTSYQFQQAQIAQQLKCKFTSKGVIRVNNHQQTNIPGLYVAGDAARDMQLIVVAAAEGAKAAVTIHKDLQSGK